jgi:uncharacterized protein YaiE (UPF0345 family)
MSRSVLKRSNFIGLAAAAAVAMSLVSAGGAQAAPAKCTIKSLTPAKFVVAATDTTRTFSVKTSGCSQKSWQVELLDGSTSVGVIATKAEPVVTFDPTLMDNTIAGAYKVKVTVTSTTNTKSAKNLAFNIARRSTFGTTFNMGPEPTTAGSTLKVVGTLKRVSWSESPSYVAYGKRSVQLQFKASGTKKFVNKKTVTTDASGKIAATVKVAKSGTWRLHYAGNATTGPADSNTDAITARS